MLHFWKCAAWKSMLQGREIHSVIANLLRQQYIRMVQTWQGFLSSPWVATLKRIKCKRSRLDSGSLTSWFTDPSFILRWRGKPTYVEIGSWGLVWEECSKRSRNLVSDPGRNLRLVAQMRKSRKDRMHFDRYLPRLKDIGILYFNVFFYILGVFLSHGSGETKKKSAPCWANRVVAWPNFALWNGTS